VNGRGGDPNEHDILTLVRTGGAGRFYGFAAD
jgi:hypothetical protein